MFPQQLYEFNFTENTSGYLTNIVASDADGTVQNNNLTYSIYDPTNSGILSVSSDGNITVNAGKLDRESATTHQFLLIAKDTAADVSEQRESSTFLIVNVLDQNDNAPVISPTNYTVNIAHYAPFQASIFDFDATDADIIGTVSFKAVNPSDPNWAFFELNSTNGDVTVKSRADVGTYMVEVYANDTIHNSSIATLNINVKDDSLHFVSDRYHYATDESTPVNFVFDIAFMQSKSSPTAISSISGKTIKYYIRDDLQHGSHDKFVMDENSGKIRVKQELDFETQRYYAFTVDAVDTSGELRNASTLVVIDVRDVVDVIPKIYVVCFDNQKNCTQGSFNLTETPSMGQVVAVVYVEDPDTETTQDGGLKYTLNDTSLPFTIISGHLQTTAYVVVNNPSVIDYETKNRYVFAVEVEDAKTIVKDSVEVTVDIIDANDNSPIFGQPNGYTFSIPESVSSSSVAGTVKATDADGTSPFNSITYSILNSAESENITINPSTGEVTVNSSIDYELVKNFDVVILATDGAMPDTYKRTKAVSVRIDITDVNDNAPVFFGASNITLDEDTPINSVVFSVSANDIDSAPNAIFNFTSSMTSPFSVEPTGEIKLVGTIDYEQDQVFTMTVVARDTGGLFSEQNITINIRNVDDNRPIFSQPLGYAHFVSEASVPGDDNILLTVSATDDDLHNFNTITYSLMNPSQDIDTSNVFPFKINATTGEISLAHPLDRESRDFYDFIVKATDDGIPVPLVGVAFVNITVTDENDNNPVFTRPCYNVTISDATIVGGTVRVVSASDKDTDMNAEIVYNLIDSTGHFTIDNMTGAVQVADHLFYKTQRKYQVEVVATDRGTPSRNGTCTFFIELTAMKNYPTTVAETDFLENSIGPLNLPNMMILEVSEKPSYELEFINQSDSSAFFTINSTDGSVLVSQMMDREKQKQHIFIRKAIVNGYVIGEETIFVNVLDMNDNVPYFAPQSINQVVNISENSEVGQIIAVLRGFDADDSDQDNLIFSVPPIPGYNFGQTTVNGTHIIFLTAEWDAEFSTSVIMSATLTDGKNIVQTSIKVNIIDENDNPPIFQQSTYKFSKIEGNSDFFVGNVLATDKDVTPFRNEIKYRILDHEPQQTFDIFENGTIVCKQTLDREQINSYEFTVEGYNTDGNNTRIGVAIVTVEVLDVNDNDPICYGPATYTFKENKPVGALFRINATDADAGENSRLTYTLISVAPLELKISVDPHTGVVNLLTPMDYEKYKDGFFVVNITDNGSPKRFVKKSYSIFLEDVNDNAPVFQIQPKTKYEATIYENVAIGSSVVQTNAVDADSGLNAQINYTLYDAFSNLPFNISKTGLISTSGMIDRENRSFYQFFVTATDQGEPALSDTILVEITILDENDNNPIFDEISYNISLAEGTPQGFSVLKVNAKDEDADLFGKVCYALAQTDNSIFDLDTNTGVLSTTSKVGALPRDYRMIINATDKDPNNPRSSLLNVNVNIKVLQLVGPKFLQNYLQHSVKENQPFVMITKTVALGDSVKYTIIYDNSSRPYADHFVISNSGDISLNKSLDYEKVKSLSFTIHASDKFNLNATQNVFITVLDENDNNPYWIKRQDPVQINVTDETRPGQVVETVEAADLDSVSHNKLKFSLLNDIYSAFDILSYQDVGKIIVTKDLRFLPSPLTIQVQVEDQAGNKANTTCSVTINVLPPNLPSFTMVNYRFSVFEAAPSAFVGTVEATGVPNIRYKIVTDNLSAPLFTIGELDGVIRTTNGLNLEDDLSYEITVEAREKDSLRFAVALVTVSIRPVNEFSPVFTSPSRYWVSEQVTVGSTFIQLHAIDNDHFYKELNYSLVNSTLTSASFIVNPLNGSVTYNGGLNFESQQVVTLFFKASDNGSPPRETLHRVEIYLANVNEHSPVFTQANFTVSINENEGSSFLVSPLTTIKATDADAGPSGMIDYSFMSGQRTSPFLIDPNTGRVTVQASPALDYEMKNYYELVVIATDKGVEPRSATTLLIVQINNLNDNRPVFNPQVYQLTISDNTPIGRSLCNVQATDKDIAPFNAFTYQITSGSTDFFQINPTTGEIYLTKAINYFNPDERSFKLIVTATDGVGLQALIPATVDIVVVQSNLQAPYFVRSQYLVTITEGQDNGKILETVAVNPSGGPVQFKIINNTFVKDEDNFVMGRSDGSVYLISNLDYEKQTRHDFEAQVTCTNTGMFGIATFTILVGDENDNAPVFVAPRSKTIHINERTNVGQEITQIHATDADSVSQNNLFFRINTPNVPFGISNNGNNGIVFVKETLPLMPKLYVMEITVFDKFSNGQLENEALQKYFLTVNVTANDKRYPVFSSMVYNYNLNENNQAPSDLFSVSTSNPSNPLYKILGAENRFSINQQGLITALRMFDAEVDSTCAFTVAATNVVNNFTSLATVRINILDLNDNNPVFKQPFDYTYPEDIPTGSFLFDIQVTDADRTVLAKTFELISVVPTLNIKVDAQTGYVFLQDKFDYETAQRHTVTIDVRDGTRVVRQAFTLNVLNVNEHDPIFVRSVYTLNLAESMKPTTEILDLLATDLDAGLAGSLEYKLIDANLYPFAVSKSTPRLYLTGDIDAETKKEYNVIVVAEDKGTPKRTGFTKVIITIDDVNDKMPVFEQDVYTADVVEIAPIGQSVITVRATDADIEDRHKVVEYKISSGNQDLFQIDSVTGIVSTKALLNHESLAYHEIKVQALDKQKPRPTTADETIVRIRVIDANEHEPTFPVPTKVISIREDTVLGRSIGETRASDSDSTFKTIKYSLEQHEAQPHFQITEVTGVISLVRSVDFESKKMYSFTVVATDNGGLKGRQNVVVNVIDVNDNAPEFNDRTNQTFIINKLVQAGQTIAVLHAEDRDTVSQGKLTMSIVNINSPFEIVMNGHSGYLARKVGFELNLGTHIVEVRVSDGSLFSIKNTYLTISVRYPSGVIIKFQNPSGYSFSTPENSQNRVFGGIVATVTDNIAPVSYRIVENNVPFLIENNGILRQAGSFDYETVTSYLVHAEASTTYDGTTYTTITSVNVQITDVNDNKPYFEGRVSVNIPEDTLVGTNILTVTAKDKDAPNTPNSQFIYSITGSNKFTIDSNTGEISLLAAVDFEDTNQRSFKLNVTAYDKGQPIQKTSQIYTVNVFNVNDNRPFFSRTIYSVSVIETIDTSTEIFCLKATDLDSNQGLQYSLSSADSEAKLIFAVSRSDGCLYYVGKSRGLDREVRSSYDLLLRVDDNGSPNLSGFTSILITVSDANDNNPIFASSFYNLQLSEETATGTEVVQFIATDSDEGSNGEIVMSITSGNVGNAFSLSSNGRLKTATSLANTPEEFNLVIKAEDRGSVKRSNQIDVKVKVIDATKFIQPTFTQAVYTGSVSESQAPNFSILTVRATYPNSVIGYEIMDSSTKTNGKFAINSAGQISLVQSIDYEQVQTAVFYVKAFDTNNRDSGFSTSIIRITIGDVNDEKPVFKRSLYQTSLARDSKVGTTIANVFAIDGDALDTNNAFVRYEFVPNSLNTDLFQVDSVTGDFSLKRTIGKADIKNYEMQIRAYDLGTPKQFSSTNAKVQVNVYPDNMFKPSFINANLLTSLSVAENAAIGTVITRITAQDEDAGLPATALAERPTARNFGSVSYQILSTGEALPFSLNSGNGQLTVANNLDRETKAFYEFHVRAQDGGSPSRALTTRVRITVNDLNEAPTFNPAQLPAITVSECSPLSVSLLKVVAVDRDTQANSRLQYSIVSGNNDNKFGIDSNSGVISLRDFLDFETVKSYSLRIRATDGKLTASPDASVTVNVADCREVTTTGFPVFDNSLYEYSIPETNAIQVLGSVRAVGATVTYSIVQSADSSRFSVISSTGQVRFNGGDYESKRTYTVAVKATNTEKPALVSTTTVRVNLEDVNDNTPFFISGTTVVASIKENEPANSHVYTSYAEDRDSGLKGMITFSFDTIVNAFTIESTNNTGIIRLRAPLDRDGNNQKSYQLRIRASDNAGQSSKSAVQTLTVNIMDVNDNNPVPENGKTSAAVNVAQSIGVGNKVFTVKYVDQDSANNGQLEYVLATPSNQFRLATNGEVFTKAALTPGVLSYSLYIIIQDKGTQPRKSAFTLTINVDGASSTAPSFNPVSYAFQVSEDAPITSIIGHLNVVDADVVTDQYEFSIKGNSNPPFTILPNGNIQTRLALDRETTSSYQLSVSVKDRAGNVASTDATVIITVSDVNDNSPVFNQASFSFDIPETYQVGNANTGPFAYSVLATDTDASNVITYTIVDTSETFKMNSQGKIYLAKSLDYNVKRQYNLFTVASDQGSPRRQVSAPITVNVLDINERPVFSPLNYVISVSEGAILGSKVATLNVLDQDSEPNNNQVRLSFESGNIQNTFRIVGNDIILDRSLDFESRNQYQLRVTASDNGSPALTASQSASVTVNVRGINDNEPVFQQTQYTKDLNEGLVSQLLVTVRATDSDQQKLSYSLDSSDDAKSFIIRIQNENINIFNQVAFDYESKKEYRFNVIASDGTFTAKALVIINVKDMNDHRPIFNPTSYAFEVDDKAPVGSILGCVKATDQDTGIFGQTTFNLGGGQTTPFQLQDNCVILKQKLDYTKTRSYVFQVTAQDTENKQVALQAASVTITVKQSQGTVPEFTQSYYDVTVYDNATIADVIATVRATDSDGTGFNAITYSIVPNTPDSKFFQIDGASGIVKLAAGETLSIRNQVRHAIVVKAVDNAGLSSEAFVIIRVLGVVIDPATPTFEVTKYFGVATDKMAASASIVRVYAFGPSGITYKIESGNNDDLFTLSEFGTVILKAPIIYDPARPTLYTLMISGTSSSGVKSTSNAEVIIQLHYLSANSPTFSSSEYTTSVSEGVAAGALTNVSASFRNSIVVGQIRYKILYNSGATNADFSIDSVTGVISTLKSFDREIKESFVFEVEAFNNAQPSSNDKALVIVTIKDVNDNAPVFKQGSSTTVTIPENGPRNMQVACVTATDADVGANAEFTYSLKDNFTIFEINNDGIISTTRPIDVETDGTLKRLTVHATDQSGKRATLSLLVNFENQNDVRPVFTNGPFAANVDETENPITSILRVQATESGESSTIKYKIVIRDAQSIPFFINEDTGIIGTNKALDYETQSRYEICVKAFDSGTPYLSEMTEVVINVNDVNDNAPVAKDGNFVIASVSEAAPVNSLVAVVKITDADSGAFGTVIYSFASGNVGDVFEIGSSTGEITVKSPLDFESKSSYSLQVSAKDNGGAASKQISQNVIVSVNVIDVNDNAPEITVSSALSVLSGRAQITVPSSQITVIDNDDSEVTLSLENYNKEFEIIPNNNQIRTKVALDANQNADYELVIKATDKRGMVSVKSTVVSVLATGNNPPVFASSLNFSISVPEDQPLNSIIGVFIATDSDVGANGRIKYSHTGTNSAIFMYENGYLTLASPLDYETTKKYEFELIASDEGTPSKSTTVTVQVHVTDVNDNSPSFNRNSYKTPLNTDNGISVQLDASDSEGDVLSYRIVQNAVSSLFQVNSSGVVSNINPLAKNVDRYYFNVEVSDGIHVDIASIEVTVGGSCSSGSGSVQMEQQTYSKTVAENHDTATALLTVKATSSGDAGAPTYSIEDGNSVFNVDANTGEIFAKSPFDYEMNRDYSVCVSAKGSTNTGAVDTTTVKITVTDINDVAPSFNAGLASFTVESSQTTPFASIVATNPGNFPINYTLQAGNTNQVFSIDSNTAELKLEKQETGTYSLTVRATSGQLTKDQVVAVSVVNTVATPPVFSQQQYTNNALESVKIGTEVAKVMANGTSVQYSVLDSLFFQVAADGSITTKLGLDYEVLKTHTFCVKATDGNSGLIAVTIVQIDVVNVDEEPPRFAGPSSASITPTFPVNLDLLTASVVEGTNVTYSFTKDEPGFSVNPTTGAIQLSTKQVAGTYTLTVFAINQYGNDTTVVTITVSSGISFDFIQQSAPEPGQLTIEFSKRSLREGTSEAELLFVNGMFYYSFVIYVKPDYLITYISSFHDKSLLA